MKNGLMFLVLSCLLIACVPPYSPTGEKDPTAPQIAAIVPADGAVDVAPGTVVTVTFTGPVDPATVHAYSLRLFDKADAAVPGIVDLSDDGLTATVTPTAPLVEGGTYTVEISRQIQDRSGIPLDIDGADGLFISHFTALATPPTVVSVAPADEDDTVDPALTEVTVTFSEPMDPAGITQATILVSDLQGTVTYDAETLTARFAVDGPLAPLHTYTIFVAGTVADASGIPMGTDLISRFTTTE